MCRDGIQSILIKGYCAWSYQVKEEEKDHQRYGKRGHASGSSVR